MKRRFAFGFMVGLLALTLAACGGNSGPAGNDARQFATDVERAVDDEFNGKGDPAALEQYVATVAEGAHAEGLANTRDAFRKVLNDHQSGVSRVTLSNFKITDVQIDSTGNSARVAYQVSVRVVHGAQASSATVSQNVTLLKTPRGWRIGGGDVAQLSNLTGALP